VPGCLEPPREADPQRVWLWQDGTHWNESHGSRDDEDGSENARFVGPADAGSEIQVTRDRLYLLPIPADM
jgi:hypothetical protein